MTAVAAYTPDLLDRSKIASALRGTRFVADPEALAGLADVELVIVDLSKAGVLEALPRIVAGGVPVVAYGPHIDIRALDSATAAGCSRVMPRSEFFAFRWAKADKAPQT